jgi:hypothetical protein
MIVIVARQYTDPDTAPCCYLGWMFINSDVENFWRRDWKRYWTVIVRVLFSEFWFMCSKSKMGEAIVFPWLAPNVRQGAETSWRPEVFTSAEMMTRGLFKDGIDFCNAYVRHSRPSRYIYSSLTGYSDGGFTRDVVVCFVRPMTKGKWCIPCDLLRTKWNLQEPNGRTTPRYSYNSTGSRNSRRSLDDINHHVLTRTWREVYYLYRKSKSGELENVFWEWCQLCNTFRRVDNWWWWWKLASISEYSLIVEDVESYALTVLVINKLCQDSFSSGLTYHWHYERHERRDDRYSKGRAMSYLNIGWVTGLSRCYREPGDLGIFC